MRIDIMTLFPDTVNAVLHESIIGRAAKKGIVEINCVQIRDYTENKQNQVDDYPYSRRSFRYWISSGSVIPAVKSDHDMAWSSESVR